MNLLCALATVTGVVATPLVVDRAEFLAGAGDRVPTGAEAGWTTVSLPDRWRERRPSAGGPGWYRFTVDQGAFPAERWAIYLPEVNMNAAVYLNGALLGVEGAMDGALGNNWNRPLFFPFPRAILRPGTNQVLIQIQARAHAFGGLGPVLVGPHEPLAAKFERQHFAAVSLAQVATFIAIWLCLWTGAMWLGTRRDPLFGWYAVAMLCFSVGSLNYHLRDLPVPRGFWEWLVNLCVDGFAVACLIFAHRLLGLARPRMERRFAVALGAGAVAMAAVPDAWFYTAAHLVHVVAATAGCLGAIAIWKHRRRLPLSEWIPVVAAALDAAAFGVHDVLLQVQMLPQERPRMLPHAVSLCVLAFGSILVVRFVRALAAGRRHTQELERAVRAREAELAAQFDRVRAFEREQLLTMERGRIMREVHDGLGGHLASTLALAQGGTASRQDIVDALRLIGEELALVIDALDPTLEDLPSLLAVLRGRIEPRLRRNGVRFQWRVSTRPVERTLRPEQLHHCLRIVQEAIANVIKHARAQTIMIRTDVEDDGLVLEIRDDGVGPGPPREHGRGLVNMQHRARELGGRLTVGPAHPGTAVMLRIPWPAPTRRAGSAPG